MMGGRIFPTGTTVIAVQQDFYKIDRLKAQDIALIRMLAIDVEGLHPLTRKSHENFLNLVCAPAILEGGFRDILRLGRLRLRGPCGARDEFLLAAAAQNLRKLAKLIPNPQPMPN